MAFWPPFPADLLAHLATPPPTPVAEETFLSTILVTLVPSPTFSPATNSTVHKPATSATFEVSGTKLALAIAIPLLVCIGFVFLLFTMKRARYYAQRMGDRIDNLVRPVRKAWNRRRTQRLRDLEPGWEWEVPPTLMNTHDRGGQDISEARARYLRNVNRSTYVAPHPVTGQPDLYAGRFLEVGTFRTPRMQTMCGQSPKSTPRRSRENLGNEELVFDDNELKISDRNLKTFPLAGPSGTSHLEIDPNAIGIALTTPDTPARSSTISTSAATPLTPITPVTPPAARRSFTRSFSTRIFGTDTPTPINKISRPLSLSFSPSSHRGHKRLDSGSDLSSLISRSSQLLESLEVTARLSLERELAPVPEAAGSTQPVSITTLTHVKVDNGGRARYPSGIIRPKNEQDVEEGDIGLQRILDEFFARSEAQESIEMIDMKKKTAPQDTDANEKHQQKVERELSGMSYISVGEVYPKHKVNGEM
ncbi:hypothetical protein EX30DRAFT_373347 [Ascodesmis nigricans]|uniref:Uncharacterized protein n=1 Tax=Ascodesmis nigricans TaxID=341454 RepID=A0A4S2MSL9_9PEZI|nr:hypothetical protein EX30DRAFT_373347 [Ascodesmis nigricans]